MAEGPSWKGYLKLSLVTCPVAMTPATSDREKIRFHTLNRATGNRVRSRYVDAETGEPVEEEAKGYETEDGNHVVLDDEEIAAAALDSERAIDIETFVPAESIAWVWYDKPYWLAPDGKVGAEAFAVIRDAMAARGVVGISRLVLARRERAVMLQPHDKGLMLWTLRYGGEVRDPAAHFGAGGEEKLDAKLVAMIKALIGERTKRWSEDLVRDPLQQSMIELIEAKRKNGAKPKLRKGAEAPPSNVVSIMDALKRSLEAEKTSRKKG